MQGDRLNTVQESKQGLALMDELGNETIRFDRVVLVGRVSQGKLDGREVPLDLVLTTGMVSRVHARLTPTDDAVLVEDLGSRNGTFINDQRVEKPTPARHGDRVRFDVVEFTLRDDRTSSATQPRKPAEDPRGTKLRAVPPKPAAPPAAAPVAPDGPESVGKKGGTVIGAVNRNLPRVWMNPGRGTVFVPSDAEYAKRDIDVDSLAAQVREPTLMVFAGDSAGYPYLLKCSGEINFWNIGRDAGAHDLSIVLNDPSVSAFHAKLVRRGDRWKISDQMAANKTYVNGEIFAAKYLESKDRLRFGRVECVFLLPRPSRGWRARGANFGSRVLTALMFWRRP